MNHPHYGAHEIIELHEALSQAIDAINVGQMYLPFAADPELRQIVHNQLAFMTDEYNRLVHLAHGRGLAAAVPYRPAGMAGTPQPMQASMAMHPNAGVQQMDDRDVASGMLAVHKAGAVMRMHAALECADADIRQSLLQGAVNCSHQAYELWSYMNRRGYYPLPLAEQVAANHLLRGYQASFAPEAAAPQPFAEPVSAPGFAAVEANAPMAPEAAPPAPGSTAAASRNEPSVAAPAEPTGQGSRTPFRTAPGQPLKDATPPLSSSSANEPAPPH